MRIMYKKIKNIKLNDGSQFLGLLILTALVLYFLPAIKLLFFIGIFYFFFKSRENYFWLAYFFTVIIDVGGFFKTLTDDIIVIGVIKIKLVFLYAVFSFLKVKFKRIEVFYFLKRNIDLWVFYIFFLIFVGLFIIGNEGGGKSGYRYYYQILFSMPMIVLLYTSYKFLPNQNALLKFSNLIFIAIILNVIGQFVHMFLGYPLVELFSTSDEILEIDNYTEKLLRPVWGTYHIFIAILLALYWNTKENKYFKNWFLILILFLSIFSTFITASRGYIIAVIVFLIFSLYVMNLKMKMKISWTMFILSFLFVLSYLYYDPVRIQTEMVFERLVTLESLVKGDLTAGGTNSRLTDRHVPVMELFYKRPIFGSGFSLEGLETNDEHVGNQNALMGGGVVGYFIILLLWFRIINATIKSHLSNKKHPGYNGEILLVIPFLLCLITVHSSSTSLFEFLVYIKHTGKFLSLGIIFAVMNIIIVDNKIVSNGK